MEKPSPLRLTWEAATSFLQDIPGDSCFRVITMFLFPDMEPDPAIDAQAKRSNFHVLWGTDKLADRLDEAAADSGYRQSTSEPYAPGDVPGGLRRRGRDQLFPTTGKPNPHCPVIRTQGANAPGFVADGPPSNSHRTILKGPFDETPPASPISPRARHPRRASAPGPAHAETPTPRN